MDASEQVCHPFYGADGGEGADGVTKLNGNTERHQSTIRWSPDVYDDLVEIAGVLGDVPVNCLLEGIIDTLRGHWKDQDMKHPSEWRGVPRAIVAAYIEAERRAQELHDERKRRAPDVAS